MSAFSLLQKKGFFICINEDPWEHHFEADNYVAFKNIADFNLSAMEHKPFIKIAKKIPLTKWDSAVIFYIENYKELLQVACT